MKCETIAGNDRHPGNSDRVHLAFWAGTTRYEERHARRLPAFFCCLILSALMPSSMPGGEVMTDRRSALKLFRFMTLVRRRRAIVLERGADGSAPWTPPFRVKLGDAGQADIAAQAQRIHRRITAVSLRSESLSRLMQT